MKQKIYTVTYQYRQNNEHASFFLVTFLQVVPIKMADKLFEACESDSFEKLDATVQVRDC